MQDSGSPASAIGSDLLRGARAVLNWSLLEAGRRAEISVSAIVSAENRGARSSSVSPADLDKLRRAYEDAGICFFDDTSAGCGLRVRV